MADTATPTAPSTPAPSGPPSGGSSAPPPTSAPGGFDSALDSMLSRPDDSSPSLAKPPEEIVDDTTEEPAPPVVEAAQSDDTELVDETDAPDKVAAPPSDEDIEYLEEIVPDRVEGGKYHTTKSKWDRLTAADKTVQELRKIDPSITVEAIDAVYKRIGAVDQMLAEYGTGDRNSVRKLANTFAGVGPDGTPNARPDAVMHLADSILENAVQHYPQAFEHIQKRILADFVHNAYEKYKQTRQEADKHLAWNLDYMLRKDFKRDVDQNSDADPDVLQERQERDRFYRDKQSFELRQRESLQRQAQEAANAAIGEADGMVDKAIEEALAAIPANVREQKKAEFEFAVHTLKKNFEEVTKGNDSYQRSYNTLLTELRANPTPAARSALVDFVKTWSKWAVGKKRSEVVSRFSKTAVTENKQTHQVQQKLQQQREPGGNNGTPVQRMTLKAKLSDPKTGFDEGIKSYFEVLKNR